MSTTAAPTVRIFRALGMTDEVTTCDHCGRAELKGTMKLAFLDLEGNVTGDLAYYGTGCAATAGKRTVKDIRDEGKSSQEEAREALRVERERISAEWTARRNAWISTNVAPDALDRPRAYGYNSTVKLVQAFIDATGDRP